MPNQNQKYGSMQCPKCGSHNTQSVSVAHQQSIRTGYNGYQSISEFGKTLEPPQPRSAFLYPLGVAYMVSVFTFFGLAEITARLEGSWPTLASWLGSHPFIASGVVGVIAGVLVSLSALGFNTGAHKTQMNRWSRGVICKQCGHRFNRKRQ